MYWNSVECETRPDLEEQVVVNMAIEKEGLISRSTIICLAYWDGEDWIGWETEKYLERQHDFWRVTHWMRLDDPFN